MNTFEQAVDAFLEENPCEDAASAKKALLLLYRLMSELAQNPGSPENWYRVQQLQSWSPLFLFWTALAGDESLMIRAAAKGNIFESDGTRYARDPEVGIIAEKNLEVIQKIFSSPDPEKAQDELRTYEGLPEAQELWVKAGFGSFAPPLRITEL